MLIGFEVKIELPIIGIISLLKREEKVSDAVRGEHRLAKDTHDLEHRSANLEVMFNDGNETVGDDGDMNLDADGILRLSPKSLDTEMLLDPFEKQLDLSPIFIKQGDFPSFEQEVVRVVDKAAVKLWSIVHNPSDDAWILLLVLLLVKRMLWSLRTLSVPSRILSPSTISNAGLPFSLMMKKAPNVLMR